MIARFKRVVRRHWPDLRLRTILLLTFVFVAALPGVGALFLRVYENTLVRQTEAELIAQGAALAAAGSVGWPGGGAAARLPPLPAEAPTIDLRLTRILPDRPLPRPAAGRSDRAVRAWAARLAPVLRLTGQATQASILLLDAQGRIVAGAGAGSSHRDLAEVRAALAGMPATTLRRHPGGRPDDPLAWLSRAADLRIHHARPIVVGSRVAGVLLMASPPRLLSAGLYADRGKIMLGILVIFATLVVLSGLLSRGVARPIEALGRATRAVAAGGGPVPEPPATAAIEIRALYRDFAMMAEAIERRSRYLRDFAHAVSHEFKTPLAGIGGAAELLQDHPDMATADRARFVANIAADAARLDRLVSRLLDLARADMTVTVAGVAAEVRAVVARVADAYDGAAFAVSTDLAAALPPAAVPPAVIEAVLVGLVENSRQAGANAVAIAGRTDAEGRIALTVRDNGPGVPPRDRARIFEPFFTSRRAAGGTGLGLPIARSLVEAHRGTIVFDDASGPGAMFRLTLPPATGAVERG